MYPLLVATKSQSQGRRAAAYAVSPISRAVTCYAMPRLRIDVPCMPTFSNIRNMHNLDSDLGLNLSYLRCLCRYCDWDRYAM